MTFYVISVSIRYKHLKNTKHSAHFERKDGIAEMSKVIISIIISVLVVLLIDNDNSKLVFCSQIK